MNLGRQQTWVVEQFMINLKLVGTWYANGDYISQNDLKMVHHNKTNFLEYHRVITCVKICLGKLKDVSKLHKKKTNIPN